MSEEVQPSPESSEVIPQIPPQIKENLDKALDQIASGPQREGITKVIREFMMTVVASTSGQPKIDPATVRILSDSIDRDNDNKFQYLMQKQRDSAAVDQREHELDIVKHSDRMKLARPITYAAVLTVIGTIVAGIWLAAIGHETLGASILSSVISAALAYLGGLGTAHFFKEK